MTKRFNSKHTLNVIYKFCPQFKQTSWNGESFLNASFCFPSLSRTNEYFIQETNYQESSMKNWKIYCVRKVGKFDLMLRSLSKDQEIIGIKKKNLFMLFISEWIIHS